MGFKSRKAAVLGVLSILLMVQLVFSNMNSSNIATETEAVDTEFFNAQVTEDEDSIDGITEMEVVSADLNVVYRSTLTSTEAVDDFEGNIDNSDYDNKIISYTCDQLNVYAEADISSEVLGIMYAGSEANIIEIGSEWTKISSGDVEGYVRNTDVLFGKEAETVAQLIGNKEATVVVDQAQVLSDPEDGSEVIDTLSVGENIEALEETSGYILVSTESIYGYVKDENVTISYGLEKAMTMEEVEAAQAEAAAAAAEEAAQAAAAAAAAEAATQAAAAKYANISTATRAAYSASAEETHLLAAIIYWESGWEPAEGQLAVANVVLNRVLSSRFKQNTITDVIYAAGQFTGVAENNAPSARFQAVLDMSNEELNVRGCYDAAITALSGQNNIGDLLFFISVKKANYAKYTSYTILNNHCFYTY